MTSPVQITRKLTTILSADAANFSGRMAVDEVGTVEALRRSRLVLEAAIAARGGRVANTAGDGMIAEFPSVVEAVAAAVSAQRQLLSEEGLLPFRIGLHLGDVIVDGEDLLGDGVNLAARIQGLATEGGVLVTRQVLDQVRGRLDAEFRPLGPATLRNIPEDVPIFAVLADGIAEPRDLADVAPLAHPGGRMPDTNAAHEEFRKTRRRLLIPIGILVAIDLTNGPGPGWPMLGVAILGFVLYRKWRALPSAPD